MKKLIFYFPTIFLLLTMCTSTPKGQKVLIETSEGNIKVVLYDNTPLHKDNFVKRVNEGYYNDLTFHRVIKGFMIQGGDAHSAKDSTDRRFDSENVVAAEFRMSQNIHKAGALAAARWGDEENPERKSDAFQFYIVTGKNIFEHDIKMLEKERYERLKQEIYRKLQSASMDTIKDMYKSGRRSEIAAFRASILDEAEKEAESRKGEILFTQEQIETYKALGGAPHLDGEYTVFGEVYEGLDIVKKIELAETNIHDKPIRPIIIKNVSLIE